MFEHFLITRFNIKVSEMGPESMPITVMDEKWLTERLKIFNTFCAPSVCSQKNKNFIWYIYLDSRTKSDTLSELQNFIQNFIAVEFILVVDFEAMIDDIRQKIKSSPKPYIISSRLDNDDVISNVYIQSVQDSFVPVENTIINFNSGFEYNQPQRVLTKWNTSLNNQFISIIESKDSSDILTVYGFPHWRPPKIARIIHITSLPAWIYIRHSHNYSGRAIKGIPVFSKKHLAPFPQACMNIKISIINTCLYAVRWFPVMINRRILNVWHVATRKRQRNVT